MNYKFNKMTDEELEQYSPTGQDDHEDYQWEIEFREWWREDPEEERMDIDIAREAYIDIQRESGPEAWDDMDDDDREGWEGNITRSFDD